MNGFSGTAASVLKVPHYVYLSLSKNKNEIKIALSVQTIVISNGHAVPLGRCGSLQVMSGCLIIFASIYGFMCPIFFTVFVIEAHQCKFYTSVMKSNLFDVQMLSLSSFMT